MIWSFNQNNTYIFLLIFLTFKLRGRNELASPNLITLYFPLFRSKMQIQISSCHFANKRLHLVASLFHALLRTLSQDVETSDIVSPLLSPCEDLKVHYF